MHETIDAMFVRIPGRVPGRAAGGAPGGAALPGAATLWLRAAGGRGGQAYAHDAPARPAAPAPTTAGPASGPSPDARAALPRARRLPDRGGRALLHALLPLHAAVRRRDAEVDDVSADHGLAHWILLHTRWRSQRYFK